MVSACGLSHYLTGTDAKVGILFHTSDSTIAYLNQACLINVIVFTNPLAELS